jgi:CrcB protein
VLKLLMIAGGGAVGSVLRYVIAGWVQGLVDAQGPFPWGILAVNVTGCLAIGVLTALFAGPLPARADVQLALIAGLLGGYTTFSSFGRDTFALAGSGHLGLAALNVLLSNVLGVLAVWGGVVAVRAAA